MPATLAYRWFLPTTILVLLGACSAADTANTTGVAPSEPSLAVTGSSTVINAARLPGLSKRTSEAFDVNDNGVVVGSSQDASGAFRPVRWTKSGTSWVITALQGNGVADAINVDGIVAGRGDRRALAWLASGSRFDLGPGQARDINRNKIVVGLTTGSPGGAAAWMPNPQGGWYPAQLLPGPPGGLSSEAFGINDNNVAVGEATDATGQGVAVTWTYDSVTGQWSDPTVLNGGNGSVAADINVSGLVVGSSPPCSDAMSCNWNAAVWESPNARRLIPGLDGGRAVGEDIDDSGAIVGASGINDKRAFWAPSGFAVGQELKAPKGLSGGRANGMNNRGVMVGGGFSGSTIHAVVWTRSP